MNPSHALAEKTIGSFWNDDYRCILVEGTPMRPGRGRGSGHLKGQRRASRRESDRFEEFVGSLMQGLRMGSLGPEMARRQIEEGDWGEFIRLAETRVEAIESFAYFYGRGYHLWCVDEGTRSDDLSIPRAMFALRQQMT